MEVQNTVVGQNWVWQEKSKVAQVMLPAIWVETN